MSFKMIAVVVVYLCGLAVVVKSELTTNKFLDLTYTFDENAAKWPFLKNFSMEVISEFIFRFEEYASSTHAGTHMDAIRPAQVPLENLIGPAAVIDIVEKASLDADAEVTVEDLEKWEEATGRTLNGTIVFMRSGWGRRYYNKTAYMGTPDLKNVTQMRFPGVSVEAARWLVDNRHIKGMGVDTLLLMRGTSKTLDAENLLIREEIYILKNVANLEKMPIYGATVYVMPMKIKGASGAPTRIVATYPDLIFKQ